MSKKEERLSLDKAFGIPFASKGSKQADEAPAETQPEAEPTGKDLRKRPGIRQHTAYLPEAVHQQLRKLAFEENRKIHDYIMEGLDLVFENRGLPAIKDLK